MRVNEYDSRTFIWMSDLVRLLTSAASDSREICQSPSANATIRILCNTTRRQPWPQAACASTGHFT